MIGIAVLTATIIVIAVGRTIATLGKDGVRRVPTRPV